jgi:hypothetical protein
MSAIAIFCQTIIEAQPARTATRCCQLTNHGKADKIVRTFQARCLRNRILPPPTFTPGALPCAEREILRTELHLRRAHY